MGVYYALANCTKKEYIYDPPGDFSVKWPGIIWQDHPLPKLLIWQLYLGLWEGDDIRLVNDSYGFPWDSNERHEWNDITQQVVDDFINAFKGQEIVKDLQRINNGRKE